MREDERLNRRRFFREGLRELIKPLSQMVEPLQQAMDQLGKMENALQSGAQPSNRQPIEKDKSWLRPPGALDERAFRDTCSRCSKCVEVCPAQCIKIDTTGIKGNGAPYIEPEVMACVVCEGLKCMHECPSGALVPTALGLIDMGTAEWKPDLCLRSHGQECTICVDRCPIGEVAIELFDGKILVHEKGCIGCGVCEHECPTLPKSIVGVPKAGR